MLQSGRNDSPFGLKSGCLHTAMVMIIPPMQNAIALAIPAPMTPSPAPGITSSSEKIDTVLVGKINKKFNTTFVIFTHPPTRMGVFVSPTARKTVPKIMEAVRNSMGAYRMKKYLDAIGRMTHQPASSSE